MTCIAVPLAIVLWRSLLKLVDWCKGVGKNQEGKEEEKEHGEKQTSTGDTKEDKHHLEALSDGLRNRTSNTEEVTES